MSAVPALLNCEDILIFILWLSFIVLVAAVVFDLRSRQIPDTLSVCLLTLALVSTTLHLYSVHWFDMLAGLLLGFVVGLILFWLGGFGGGDVKLISGLGAVVGFRGELGVMFYVAVLGGAFALVARFMKKRDLAYAPAIALGFLAFVVRAYFP